MEEDIKILEGYLDRNTQLFEDYGESAIIQDKEIQAIENLIKGYRELEERTISLTNLLCINDSDENYIPKSKVKEKIDELEELKKELEKDNNKFWHPGINNIIYHIQELMEDK